MNATIMKGERSKLLAVAVVLAMVACALVAFMPAGSDAVDIPKDATEVDSLDEFITLGTDVTDVKLTASITIGAEQSLDLGTLNVYLDGNYFTLNGGEVSGGTLFGSMWGVRATEGSISDMVFNEVRTPVWIVSITGDISVSGCTFNAYNAVGDNEPAASAIYAVLGAHNLNVSNCNFNGTYTEGGVNLEAQPDCTTVVTITGSASVNVWAQDNNITVGEDLIVDNAQLTNVNVTEGTLVIPGDETLKADSVTGDGFIQATGTIESDRIEITYIETETGRITVTTADALISALSNDDVRQIVLGKDITIEGDSNLVVYKSIDLAGFDLTVPTIMMYGATITDSTYGSGETGTVSVSSAIDIAAESTISNVTIDTDAGMATAIRYGISATFENVIFTGDSSTAIYYCVSDVKSTVTVTGCDLGGKLINYDTNASDSAGKVSVNDSTDVSLGILNNSGSEQSFEYGTDGQFSVTGTTNIDTVMVGYEGLASATLDVADGETLECTEIIGPGSVSTDAGTIDCPTIDVPIVDGTTGTVRTAEALITALSNETVEKIVLDNDIIIDRESRLEVTKSIDLGTNTLTLDCGEWRNGNLAIMASETQITIENGTIDAPDAIRAYQADITFENVTFLYGNVLTGYSTSMAFNGCTFGTADGNTDFGVYYSSGNSCALTVNADCVFYGTYDQGAVALEGSAPTVGIDAYVPTLNIWISADEDTSKIDISGGIGETWVSGISSSTELTTKISIPGERVMLYDCRGNGGLTVGTGAELLTPEAKRVVLSEGFNFMNKGSLSEGVVVEDGDFVEPTVEIEGLPEIFQTYEEVVFSVTTTAGDYAGTMVAGIISGGSDAYTLYYLDNNEWEVMDTWFGSQTGFPLIDGTSYFKVVFDEPDQLDITIDIMMVDKPGEVIEGQTLCSDSQKLLVTFNPEYKEPRQKDDFLMASEVIGDKAYFYILANEDTSDYTKWFNPYHEVYFVPTTYLDYEAVKTLENYEVRMTTTDKNGYYGENDEYLILAVYEMSIPQGIDMIDVEGYVNWDGIDYFKIEGSETVMLPSTVTIVDENGEEYDGGVMYEETTLDLDAVIAPEDVDSSDVKWTSSDNNIATVDDNGVVTAISAGEVTITVTTVNGMADTCTITVKEPKTLQRIEVTGNGGTYYLGDMLNTDGITVTAYYNEGEPVVVEDYQLSGTVVKQVAEGYQLVESGSGLAVKVSYTDGEVTAEGEFTVTVGKVESVTSTVLVDLEFAVGENVNISKLIEKSGNKLSIMAHYTEDLADNDVTNFCKVYPEIIDENTSQITVIYTEPVTGNEYRVTVNIDVTGEVTTEP